MKNFEIELKLWLLGIQEDDPLPFEIKFVYFVVDFSCGNIDISFSGSERFLDVFDYGFFCPLEAEYFSGNSLKQLEKTEFKNQSKQQILEQLKHSIVNVAKSLPYLKTKIIYIGERFKKVVV